MSRRQEKVTTENTEEGKKSLSSGILSNHVANIELDQFILMMIIKFGKMVEISKLLLHFLKLLDAQFII